MNKLRNFDFSVLKKLRSYVYVLIDPLDDEVFYVGKGGADGKGNQRLSEHFDEAEKLKAQPEKQSDKVKRILEIWRRNQDVKWLILRHGLNATEAHEVEAAVIDALDLSSKRLMNVIRGHSTARSMLTMQDIIRQSAPLVRPGKNIKVFIFQIHKHPNIAGNSNITPNAIYEATRRAWRIGRQYRHVADDYYAVGVVQNVSIGAYKIEQWKPDNEQPNKYIFWKSKKPNQQIIESLLSKNWSKQLSEASGYLQHGGGNILVEFNENNQFRILKGRKSSEDSWSSFGEMPESMDVRSQIEYDSEIDAIISIIESEQARKCIKKGNFDFPGSEVLDDWNSLPFGQPSACKEKLIVFISDKNTAFDVVAASICHVGNQCRGITKRVLFAVIIDQSDWDNAWQVFSPAFWQLEASDGIDVLIHHLNELGAT